MSLLDGAKIDLQCPSCSRKFQEAIGRLKRDPTVRCPSCQQHIKIEASDLRKGLSGADAALTQFEQSLKRLGK